MNGLIKHKTKWNNDSKHKVAPNGDKLESKHYIGKIWQNHPFPPKAGYHLATFGWSNTEKSEQLTTIITIIVVNSPPAR
jgi:hypothetical protein